MLPGPPARMHGVAHGEWTRWRLEDSAITKRNRPHTRSRRASVCQVLQWAEARFATIGELKIIGKLYFILQRSSREQTHSTCSAISELTPFAGGSVDSACGIRQYHVRWAWSVRSVKSHPGAAVTEFSTVPHARVSCFIRFSHAAKGQHQGRMRNH